MNSHSDRRSNIILLQTLATSKRIVNEVNPLTEEFVCVILRSTCIIAQIKGELELKV
jgi:hypothetical protein